MKETYRDQRGLPAIETFLQDLRYAARMLRRDPAFATVAIISLAIGIGASTAAFSVFNAVMLRPLPVSDPGRLVLLQPQRRGERFIMFNPIYEELRERQTTLSGMFAAKRHAVSESHLRRRTGAGLPARQPRLRQLLRRARRHAGTWDGCSPSRTTSFRPLRRTTAVPRSSAIDCGSTDSDRALTPSAGRCESGTERARSSGSLRPRSRRIRPASRRTSGFLYGRSRIGSCSPAAGWRFSPV